MGLKASEHIGKILVDPRDSNVVLRRRAGPALGARAAIAASTRPSDGGKTWKAGATVDENTGVNDVRAATRAIRTCSTRRPTSAAVTSGR